MRDKINPSLLNQTDQDFLEASENALKAAKEVEISFWAIRNGSSASGARYQSGGGRLGLVFAQDADEDLLSALKELREHRRDQAGKNREIYYREFFGPEGYRPGESAQDFLRRHGAISGLNNPEKVPYYLLIVGDPDSIPFEFQYDLDEQYAVGRIYFEELVEYQSYARSVRVCEVGTVQLPNTARYFSPRFPGDQATSQAYEKFSQPLLKGLQILSA